MAIRRVQLIRSSRGDSGTYGLLGTPGFRCFTGELPPRDNQRGLSCIPEGEYDVRIVKSPHFGRIYGLFGVPGRTHVLMHSGNFSGDVQKGYQSHVEGCILLGSKLGRLQNKFGQLQSAVLISLPTVTSFMRHMGGDPFILAVSNTYTT